MTSNSVASYFHDLGSRDRAHDLIARDWLALNPAVSGEEAVDAASLGGNYGEDSPSSLGFNLASSSSSSVNCEAEPDTPTTTYANSLTVS